MKSSLSWTLSRYLGLKFLAQLLIIGGALSALVYLFEVVELFRRAGDRDISASTILWMGVLKLPETLQIITPFIFLVSSLTLFWQLGRSSELVVMRANGISVWRFTAPIVFVALLLGVLNFALFQPIGAASMSRYQTLETKFFGTERRIMALNAQGLWLRESNKVAGKTFLLHAAKIDFQSGALQDLMVLTLDDQGRLIERTDAAMGRIDNQDWVLARGLTTMENGRQRAFQEKTIATGIDKVDIMSSFNEAATISAWDLQKHIETLAASGFPTRNFNLYFYNLWAAPWLWVSMILIALTVSLTPHRMGKTVILLAIGVVMGFFYFLFARYFEALSLTQRIPEAMAVWTPIVIATFIPISLLIQKEDG